MYGWFLYLFIILCKCEENVETQFVFETNGVFPFAFFTHDLPLDWNHRILTSLHQVSYNKFFSELQRC